MHWFSCGPMGAAPSACCIRPKEPSCLGNDLRGHERSAAGSVPCSAGPRARLKRIGPQQATHRVALYSTGCLPDPVECSALFVWISLSRPSDREACTLQLSTCYAPLVFFSTLAQLSRRGTVR